jgi:hypothetical protein
LSKRAIDFFECEDASVAQPPTTAHLHSERRRIDPNNLQASFLEVECVSSGATTHVQNTPAGSIRDARLFSGRFRKVILRAGGAVKVSIAALDQFLAATALEMIHEGMAEGVLLREEWSFHFGLVMEWRIRPAKRA